MKTKERIANEMYGLDLDDLSAGEKAAVTRAYNAQRSTRTAPVGRAALKVMVGRVDVNGTTTCLVSAGTTVREVLEQAHYSIDEDKEKVLANSVGEAVELDSAVVNNETYIIAPEIKSAQ
ncbi:MAG: ubiquitin-like domain-containing protein [Candidatus Bathyarchaeota archaeon]